MRNSEPTFMEPILNVEISVPESYASAAPTLGPKKLALSFGDKTMDYIEYTHESVDCSLARRSILRIHGCFVCRHP
jgi:hypothetical protein